MTINDIPWQTGAAVVSAVTAVAAGVAAWWAAYSVRKSLWLQALSAMEQRLAQINQHKIGHTAAWGSIETGEPDSAGKHLIFDTFLYYHHAFGLVYFLKGRKAIKKKEYDIWHSRMDVDLADFRAYRNWWRVEREKRAAAWIQEFVDHVNHIVDPFAQQDAVPTPAQAIPTATPSPR